MRPSEIHKCLPEAAPRVLDIQLKEMVEDGLIGKSLLPIIDAMLKWGEDHFEIFERKYQNKK